MVENVVLIESPFRTVLPDLRPRTWPHDPLTSIRKFMCLFEFLFKDWIVIALVYILRLDMQ